MKTTKARVLLFISVITIVSGLTWALKAQTKQTQQANTYSVTLTPEQWNNVIGGLESIKNAVKVSNMPAIQSTFISDSLISVYQNEFSRQINKQIELRRPMDEVKKDSTKPKKTHDR